MSKKCRCVLDTETTNGFAFPLPYDISYIIYKGSGAEMEVVCKKSFVIREIFLNSELMDTAYYAAKIPQYWEAIWTKEKRLVTAYQARTEFYSDLKKYHCKEIYAYNMVFDRRSLNSLMRYTTDGRYKSFWKKGIKLYCIWNMASQCFLSTKKYYETAKAQGWFSEKGNMLTNAQCAYRYITQNYTFEEAHVGIDDCAIEGRILNECLKSHKKLDKTPKSGVWQVCQKWRKRDTPPNTNEVEGIA